MSPETRRKISESNKGRIVTQETRDKISIAQIGIRIPITCPCGKSILVKKCLIGRKKYCSKSCKLKYAKKGKATKPYVITKENKGWYKKGQTPFNKGTQGFMKPNAGSFKKGQRISIKTEYKKGQQSKNKHPNWKGGITPLTVAIRNCDEYKNWRKAIFKRDNFTCQICGVRGNGNLEADHYPIQFSSILYENNISSLQEAINCNQFWDVSNGRTLCEECHKKYGKKQSFGRNKITIFGASGTLGSHLIYRLIEMGHKNILAVARNENQLVALKEKFPTIDIMVGDIGNPWIVKRAMYRTVQCYVCSAMKHVGLSEQSVKACVNTNIIGLTNIIGESFNIKPRLLMFISTDKAAQPTGIYGCTKKIGEKLMNEAEQINPETNYRVVRYGNVFGSNGSIITKWKPKMIAGEEVILTDPDASRFFFTIDEAVDLIFTCIKKAKNSDPYIPSMKAASMGTVLEACMEVYGKSPVKMIGLQPGENRVETMDGRVYSDQVEQFSVEEFKEKFLLNGKN